MDGTNSYRALGMIGGQSSPVRGGGFSVPEGNPGREVCNHTRQTGARLNPASDIGHERRIGATATQAEPR